MHIQDKFQQYLKQIIKRDGKSGTITFDCHWVSMESCVEMKSLAFCSGYTLFQNLQKFINFTNTSYTRRHIFMGFKLQVLHNM